MKSNEAGIRVFAVVGMALVLVSAILAVRSPVAADLRQGTPLAGVLLGTDLVDYARHSDTLMVWQYHPDRASLEVLSIPRDTKIDLPGYRFNRVNEIFAYHYGIKRDHRLAAEEVMNAVASLLSIEEGGVRPRYYAHVDYDGFRRLVNLLGGVEIQVDEPLHYDDNAGDFHVHFEPGSYVLQGDEALEYVRFRGRSGDRGRILRQLEFLKSAAERLSSPTVFLRWPQMLLETFRSLHTNFRVWDVLFLAFEAKRLAASGIHPWLMPGRPKGAYWEMDRERVSTVLRQMSGTGAPAAEEVPGVTVKVWNGSSTAGLALKVTRRLRSAGFDVLEWGNYNGRQLRTRVLDRVGNIERAQAVAQALGAEFVLSDVSPKLQVDVEVILGDDYSDQ